MKRTTGLCLAFGLLAAAGLFALFVLPRSGPADLGGTTPAPAGGGAAVPEDRPGPPPARPGPRNPGPDLPPEGPDVVAPADAGHARVLGRVTGPDGEPLGGALVYPAPADAPVLFRAALASVAASGEDGRFGLEFDAGVVDLIVYRPGYRPAVLADLVLAPGEPRDLGDVSLAAGLTISGRIVDTEGRPVRPATAAAWRQEALRAEVLLPGPAAAEAWGGRGETNERGEFTVSGLGPGRYFLSPEGVGLVDTAEKPVSAPAGAADVRLVVKRVRVATGQVVSEADGSPVTGATVTVTLATAAWAGSLIVTTDEAGRFVIDLSEERFAGDDLRIDVSVAASGFEEFTRVGIPVADARPEATLTLRLVPAPDREPGRLKGRILYDTGDPFRDGWITLSFSREGRPSQAFRVRTDSEGAFAVEGILPGDYALRTAPRDGRVLADTGRRLSIPSGGEEVADLTIPRGADLELSVVDGRGDVVPGAQVEVIDPAGESLGAWGLPGGAIVVPDLAPGRLTIRATAPGFGRSEEAVDAPKGVRTPVRIVLEPR